MKYCELISKIKFTGDTEKLENKSEYNNSNPQSSRSNVDTRVKLRKSKILMYPAKSKIQNLSENELVLVTKLKDAKKFKVSLWWVLSPRWLKIILNLSICGDL